jgi:hypothetical protein
MSRTQVKGRLGMAPIWAVFVGVLALFLLFGRRVGAEPARSESEPAASEHRAHNPNPAESHPFGFAMGGR